MEWPRYYCHFCNKKTAYVKGGIVGFKEVYMACDVCGNTWKEIDA